IIVDGESYVFNYGVKSKEPNSAVDDETLFEVGSISKTMTGTLATYAQAKGRLSLKDPVSKFIPELKKSDFAEVTLINLGTHTSGELPLQVPDEVKSVDSLFEHYKTWKSKYEVGTQRTYSNVGIGLLGFIAAKSLGGDFENLMKEHIFSKVGMQNTFLSVPVSQMKNYAQGYTDKDVPKRMSLGVFYKEAYGVRSTASDILRFLKANMQHIELESDLAKAFTETHQPYFQVEPMTQDFVWEQFPYPVSLSALLTGNSKNAASAASVKMDSSKAPVTDVWINKTGSTSGFAAYVAFIPSKKTGIVLLANKVYPMAARVTAAHEILKSIQ
ncbi:MAG: beta-lactamase, partial [Proteobacteria bacterium]